jgi:GNAT superfamily N-acetyltransferase
MIRIEDSGRESIRHTLNVMDEHCFPADDLCSKEGYWWISYQAGEPSGFAGMRILPLEPDTAYLCRAGVLESYRGLGIQRKLIRVRVAYARRLGLNTIVTDTTDNIPSANNLMASGFRLYEPANAWAAENSLYWRMTL